MEANSNVIGLVGSPNREGRTHQLVTAALEGAAKAGVATELIQMADHVVAACKDCLPWVCLENLKCTFEDDAFDYYCRKIMNCGALILGTPVYWWDTSGMVKYFILKMFRIYARSAPLQGLPSLGIGIAGGTGNGLISGLRPVYHFFQMMQMRALEPVRRNIAQFAVEFIALDAMRLEEMFQRVWQVAFKDAIVGEDGNVVVVEEAVNLKAVDRLLRIQQRRAKTLGVDNPDLVTLAAMTDGEGDGGDDACSAR